MIELSDEVRAALDEGRPVVALETTLIAHGFPPGEGVAVGLESERRVREAGATPATIGVLDGEVRVGLDEHELERFGATARKLGPRDVAAAVAQRAVGATTVGGTLAVARTVGLRFMGTGGIGGVHRGWTQRPDISSDLGELARTRVVVVASGAKSILDVPAPRRRSRRSASRRSASARTRCRSSTRRRWAAGLRPRRVPGRRRRDRERALGARRGGPPRRQPAGAEPRRRRGPDRAGARGGRARRRRRPGPDAVRALVAAPRERRANARGEPRARRGQRRPGCRSRSCSNAAVAGTGAQGARPGRCATAAPAARRTLRAATATGIRPRVDYLARVVVDDGDRSRLRRSRCSPGR